jgi:hypothetical protein
MMTAAGCGRAIPELESRRTYPVEGSVLVEGKLEEGVQVFFHPVDASQRGVPRGVTDAEGRFQLRTYHDGDGAPAGEYIVTAYWPDSSAPKVSDDEQLPPDRLHGRFANPGNSPLRATVAAPRTALPPFAIK